jgi:hypothetical protein
MGVGKADGQAVAVVGQGGRVKVLGDRELEGVPHIRQLKSTSSRPVCSMEGRMASKTVAEIDKE